MTIISEAVLEHKPDWFRIQAPSSSTFQDVKTIIKSHGLTTVCEEARCPNLSECWSGGTATFMVMGDTCTRGCRFCHVKTARFGKPLDPDEPLKLAQAVREMGMIEYVVITSVDRDDLPDQGSSHFANCIKALKADNPDLLIEVLIPDFRGNTDLINTIIEAKPDVIAHNLETVESLQKKVRDPRANYGQSLSVLRYIKEKAPLIITKSSLMLGLGETEPEILQAMKDLREIKVDILTLGQYLRPSQKHCPIIEYVSPEKFRHFEVLGKNEGFAFVASGPLVRSSYKAGELFIKHFLEKRVVVHG